MLHLGLTGELREAVLADAGNIPMLTEPAPDAVQALLNSSRVRQAGQIIYLGWR